MKGVSGTLRTITLTDGTKRKVVATCSKSGKQRIYFRDYKPRTSKISENEIRCRERFAQATRYFMNLTPEQKQVYAKEWKKSRYQFKGKKYATLRGFIVAKFYDLYPVR